MYCFGSANSNSMAYIRSYNQKTLTMYAPIVIDVDNVIFQWEIDLTLTKDSIFGIAHLLLFRTLNIEFRIEVLRN